MAVSAGYKIILDVPSAAPALGFDSAADALQDIIENSSPQFAIGIFGTWGSGKTTLMRAIEKKLNASTSIAVQFSAWRYEKEPNLIVPLLDVIREVLIDWSERNENFRGEAVKTASTVGKAIYSLLAGMSLKVGLPHALEVSFDANKALGENQKFKDAEKSARTPRSFYHAAFKSLSEAFGHFLASVPESRIVVFVDDLDRCLPQGALEVLEAMKLFFDLEGFVFVVGLDQAVVERSIDLKYRVENASGESGSYQVRGADYIKKIFQLPYALAPVAVTQLDEFLDAVYAEAQLSAEQESDLRNVVTPHLHYLVTESSVNPREIKRYINAYTLVIRIKSHLDRNVVLALQTIAFRRDWEVVRRAILSYRGIFINALQRQVSGADSTAVMDLDETLASIPESFISYVTDLSPGSALLKIPNIDEYIYAGAATQSSLGSFAIDIIRDIAQLSKSLRPVKTMRKANAGSPVSSYVSLVTSTLGRTKGFGSGRVMQTVQSWQEHLTAPNPFAIPYPVDDPGLTEDDREMKAWIEQEEAFRRRLLNQLMELYQSGSQAGSSLA